MSNRLQTLSTSLTPQPTRLSQMRQHSQLDPPQLLSLIFSNGYPIIQQVYNIFSKHHSIFNHHHLEEYNIKQSRYDVARLLIAVTKQLKIDIINNPERFLFIYYATTSYALQFSLKLCLPIMNYVKTIVAFQTNDKHRQFIHRAMSYEDIGAYCLTQFQHGSYSQGMLTQARYDQSTQQFILTTNGYRGMKYWVGGLAEVANMALVWAQLIVKGVNYGPHPFVLQIRNRQTYDVLSGIRLGDVGPKSSGPGLDNGYMVLDNVRIPKENLLGRLGDVDQQGNYKSQVKSLGQRFGMHMSPLSGGRAYFCYHCLSYCVNGLTIAIRYVCSRRQFDNSSKTGQTFLIDYPITRFRLIPLIAKTLIYFLGSLEISLLFVKHNDLFKDINSTIVSQLHAISSTLKAKTTTHTADTLIECRALLGGHGYSLFSRLGVLYQDNQATLTGEGDNNVILQQTSKFLLKTITTSQRTELFDISYLYDNTPINTDNKQDVVRDIHQVQTMLKDLFKNKYQQVKSKMQQLMINIQKPIQQWNYLQPYFANKLALLFGDIYFLQIALTKLKTINSQQTKKFITNCLYLWAFQLLQQQRYGTLQLRKQLQEEIVKLSDEIVQDYLKFLDIVAPPEFVIGSPFADYNGNGMKEYINLVYAAKDTFRRSEWFQEIVDFREGKWGNVKKQI